MNNIFTDMTNNDGITYLQNTVAALKKTHNYTFPIRLNKTLLSQIGNTVSFIDEIGSIDIGVQELNDHASEPLDMDAFINAYVALFHESGHADQIQKLTQQTTDTAKYITLNNLACACSIDYYNNNYWQQPKEIAAQYVGIRDAYFTLCGEIGKDDANTLICNYVNKRCHNDSEFIELRNGKDYENVQDIFDEFDRTFKDVRKKKKQFDISELKESQQNDTVGRLFQKGKETLLKYAQHWNGQQQDLVLASLYLREVDPNHRKQNYLPVLQNIDFNFIKIPNRLFSLNTRKMKKVTIKDLPDYIPIHPDEESEPDV